MNPEPHRPLFAALRAILYPLVRILLRNAVPLQAFMELVKRVYVEVADREFGISGRKQSDSRIAIITGLSRKEVRRLKQVPLPSDQQARQRYNRAARVISGWQRDPRFTDADGNPRPLDFEKGAMSFSDLVKEFSGDVPPRAVLDELRRVGAVSEDADGRLHLRADGYVPAGDEPELLAILGTDTADLVRTIDHNIVRGAEMPFFQRKVAYDNVPEEALAEFRTLAAGEGQRLLERLDAWLARHDRDLNPRLTGTGRKRVGLGVFYFEDDFHADSPPAGGQGGAA